MLHLCLKFFLSLLFVFNLVLVDAGQCPLFHSCGLQPCTLIRCFLHTLCLCSYSVNKYIFLYNFPLFFRLFTNVLFFIIVFMFALNGRM